MISKVDSDIIQILVFKVVDDYKNTTTNTKTITVDSRYLELQGTL